MDIETLHEHLMRLDDVHGNDYVIRTVFEDDKVTVCIDTVIPLITIFVAVGPGSWQVVNDLTDYGEYIFCKGLGLVD